MLVAENARRRGLIPLRTQLSENKEKKVKNHFYLIVTVVLLNKAWWLEEFFLRTKPLIRSKHLLY